MSLASVLGWLTTWANLKTRGFRGFKSSEKPVLWLKRPHSRPPLTTGERLGALVFMYKKDSGGLIPNPLNSCEYSGNGSQFMPDNSPWQHRSEAEVGGQQGLVEWLDKLVRSRDGSSGPAPVRPLR